MADSKASSMFGAGSAALMGVISAPLERVRRKAAIGREESRDQVNAIIEGEIIPAVSDHLQETWKHDGVEARYRKGARRVTYKWQTVDSVLGVLRDVLPETAITLEGARSESIGKPSVNVVRVV